MPTPRRRKQSLALRVGRDGGGSYSGMPSPEMPSGTENEANDEVVKSLLPKFGEANSKSDQARSPLAAVQESSTSRESEEFKEGTVEGDVY